MTITNRLNLPKAIVDSCQTDQHCAPDTLSITTLLKGTKEIILTERHWEEMTDDAADRIWAIFGTAVHKVLEESESENVFNEAYLSHEVCGIKITGKMDVYNMAEHVIDDYKTASVWKIIKGDFEDWRMQGIGYAWLLVNNGFEVKKARFTALLKDHKKSEARNKADYPKSPCYIYEFDISDADIAMFDSFVREKVTEYIRLSNFKDDTIPECSEKERWASEDTFAVMKEGRKSAVRVFVEPVSAESFLSEQTGGKYYIEKRPGESKKCLEYCGCCDFCNFYYTLKKGENDGSI
jgi:hypothetical protein